MAIVNGTEFEFIDLQSNSGGNTTRHMLRDAQARQDVASAANALDAMNITPIAGLEQHNGNLGSSTWYMPSSNPSAYRHIVIPVNGGETLAITPNGANTYYALLSEYTEAVSGETIPYSSASGWTGRKAATAGTAISETIPSGGGYLVYVCTVNGADATPASLTIDGYDYAKSTRQNFGSLAEKNSENEQDIAAVSSDLGALTGNVNALSGRVGSLESGAAAQQTEINQLTADTDALTTRVQTNENKIGSWGGTEDITSTLSILTGGLKATDGKMTVNANATSYRYCKIPISGESAFIAQIRVYSSANYPYYVYQTDSEDNIITSEAQNDVSSGSVIRTETVIPVSGAAYVYIMTYQFGTGEQQFQVFSQKTYDFTISERIGAPKYLWNSMPAQGKENGRIGNNSGTIDTSDTNATYYRQYYNVASGDICHISCYANKSTTNYPNYAYAVDEVGSILGEYGAAQSSASALDFYIEIPNGANKLYVMCYGQSRSIVAKRRELSPDLQTQIDDLSQWVPNLGTIGISRAKWLALGDSITEGWYSYIGEPSADQEEGAGANAQPNADTKYWARITAGLRGWTLDNRGVGGTGWVRKGSDHKNSETPPIYLPSARCLIDGTYSITKDGQTYTFTYDTPDWTQYNLITLAWGVNDWKKGAPFGSDADNIETDDTVYANMCYVIEHIMAANPNCKLIVISPINCGVCDKNNISDPDPSKNGNWGIGFANPNGKTLEDLFLLEKEVCEHYGIEYIDMLHQSVVGRENLWIGTAQGVTGGVLLDKVHPSLTGHELMGRELAQKINFS